MAPELLITMECNELRDLALRIAEWQETRKLSDAALLKLCPQLGSTKTYKRVLNPHDDLAELDLENQLANFRTAWAWIESQVDEAEDGSDELYEDLWAAIQLRKAFTDTRSIESDARVILVLGASGMGKSAARRLLVEKYGTRLIWMEASVAWGDSPMAMLGVLLGMLGKKDKPSLQIDRLDQVVERLKDTRRCLLIEEAHHLGPRCLNLVKTLVNQTPGEFVLLGIHTLWRRLETKAYEEATQITGNRLAERIDLGSRVREKDVEKLLTRRVEWIDDAARKSAQHVVMAKADNYGRLAFVRDVCKRAAVKAGGKPVTAELFAEAISEEVASR